MVFQIIILFPFITFCQDNSNQLSDQFEISKLPANIKYENNEISMFADFKNIDYDKGAITLYIINDSKANHYFGLKNVGKVILPEYLTREYNWKRSRFFDYEMCNVSLDGNDIIEKGKFRKCQLDYAIKGRKEQIRFRLYDYVQLVSNVGTGYIDSNEVKKTIVDDISVQYDSYSELSKIVLGYYDDKYSNEDFLRIRTRAFWAIRKNYGFEKAEFIYGELVRKPDERSQYVVKNVKHFLDKK